MPFFGIFIIKKKINYNFIRNGKKKKYHFIFITIFYPRYASWVNFIIKLY